MFIQRCFIIKNSKELRDKVYRLGGRNGKWLNEASEIIACSHDMFRCHDLDLGAEYTLVNKGYIHCGKNEELFLAIAALRDDSDIHQWFVHQDGSFLKCECDSKIDMWGDYEYPQEVYPRKATIEELIKHYGHEPI